MSSDELALFGGTPVLTTPPEKYSSIGIDERNAVLEVIESGCLSGFYGSWEEGFLGGATVQQFEERWSSIFGVGYTISVNSNSSGLMAAMGAVGVGPGDEVIVPPTTMSATAMAPIIYGAIPVFADIEDQTFCLDVEAVKSKISSKTKAVIVVNLFGHPAQLAALRAVCDEYGIALIEDNAQAICATENGQLTGTVGDIGVFSLNYHKHIHTGEGGMCVTNNPQLAQRLRMIRNHAEAVVEAAGVDDLVNMVGFNLRMTELSAAVGLVQLEKLDVHVSARKEFAIALSTGVSGKLGLTAPVVRENCSHSFYNWMLKYNSEDTGVPRNILVDALSAEGVPCFQGYVRPLYHLPIFQKKVAIGSEGYPFSLSDIDYSDVYCSVAERLYSEELIGIECCAWNLEGALEDRIILAFDKVYRNIDQLRNHSKQAC